ncbi:MAG: hypothetical protein ABID35_05420 [Candidatus Margulisiibacteriota bacterium]
MRLGKIARYSVFYAMMFGALGGYRIATHQAQNQQRPSPTAQLRQTNNNLSPEQLARKSQIEREIQNIRDYVWHGRDLNLGRIRIAQLNLELASIDPANRYYYLEDANLAIASVGADEGFQFHQSGEYVRDYLEVRFQVAANHFANQEHGQAIATYQQILSDLNREDIRLAQQVHEYSVPGYRNRANLEMALVYLNQGNLAQARPLFEGVRGWARDEANRSSLSLYYMDENRKDLRYLDAKATISLASISIRQREYNIAFSYLNETLRMEETGEADGFMDIGFEALIDSMWASLDSSPNLEQARARFRAELPWERINSCPDLIASLGQPNGLPIDSPELWNIVLQGLRNVELNEEQESLLRQITITTETFDLTLRNTPGGE